MDELLVGRARDRLPPGALLRLDTLEAGAARLQGFLEAAAVELRERAAAAQVRGDPPTLPPTN